MKLYPLNMTWAPLPLDLFSFIFLISVTILIELAMIWVFHNSKDFKFSDIYLAVIFGNIITGLLGLLIFVVVR